MAEGGGDEKAGGSTPTVFISYASQDAAVANSIVENLEQHGLRCWLAPRDVKPGALYADAIVRAINEANAVVLVLSTSSVASSHVGREVERAGSKHKRIIGFRIDAAPLSAELEYFLSNSQWIDVPAIGMPAALAKVAEAAAQGSGQTVAANHVASARPLARTGGKAKLIAGAAVVVSVGVAVVLGVHFSSQSHRVAQPAAAVAITDKSIAVLPFVDLSEKHDQEYFSDGLAEELIDVLTRVRELRVPARTSSFAFKGKAATIGEIARTLAVTHVLEGSVRKSGERLRITAQLVRADTGFHLWSQTYDRDVRDIFAIQGDIAQAVVEQLKITLLGSVGGAPKQTTSTEAHNLYLQARNLTDRDTQTALDQAVTLYQRALEVDPNYAPAWAWLARCHVRRVSQGLDTTGAGFARATTAATRAIEIDPSLPDPYIVLASAHLQYDLDWKAAQAELRKVAELEPNNAYAEEARGHLTVAVGRISDAVTHFQRAVELDPLNLLHRKYLGRALHYARRSVESREVLQEAIGLNAEFPGLHYELGRALLLLGQREEAQQAFAAEQDHAWRTIGLPLGYWAVGRQREARTALDALLKESQGSEFQVAEAYGFFGDTDQCLEWLEKARTLHDPGVIYFRRDALLESVAKDPRFDAFRKRLGVPAVAHDD